MLHAGALWDGLEAGARGRVAVLGSSSMFDDSWLGVHSNRALLGWLLFWLLQACPAVLIHAGFGSCGMHHG